MSANIILASESPFRKQLMEQLGLNFESMSPKVDEEQLKDRLNVPPVELPALLAKAKAESLVTDHPDSLIIGSDQVLILNGKALNKPNTEQEVLERLNQLQGQSHQLHTAIAIYYQGHWEIETIIAELEMISLSQSDIQQYFALDPAIGCAGGYKIESKGALLFKSIKTQDHFSIVGLPLLSVAKILRKFDFSLL